MLLALLLAAQVVTAPKPPEKCSLSGTVLNSATGEAAGKVQILAEPEGATEGAAPATVTDARGNFRIVGLEPGRYRLRARRNGFLETYYGARRSDSKGTLLRLEPGQQIKDLNIKLRPFGVISGTIRDSEGEPLLGVNVSVLRFKYEKGKREIIVAGRAQTDDIGQYRVANLAPGQYYVRAKPATQSDSGFTAVDHSAGAAGVKSLSSQLYPGVTDSRAATSVDVGPGSRVSSIDLVLPETQVFHVTGRVALPAANVSMARVELFSTGAFGPEMMFLNLSSKVNKDGTFDIQGVPPGSYRLQGIVFHAEGNSNPLMTSHNEVTVNREDLTDVRVNPATGAAVRARVVVEGGNAPELEGANLRVQGIDNASSSGVGIRKGEQVFRMELQPGRYSVEVNLPPRYGSLFLKSVRTGTTDVLAEGLTVAGPAEVELDVVLSAEAGKVAGSVTDKDGNAVQGATVVVVPAHLRTRLDLFKDVITDQTGRFELGSVAPGDYKIFAWDDVEPGIWFDPDFLKRFDSEAESVKVSPKGQSTVPLRALPYR